MKWEYGSPTLNQQNSVQAVKKAQAVLGMINRHFKDVDKEDFGCVCKTYVRPHLKYCIQAW